MKIYINDDELDFTLENEKTCGDVLNQLQIELEKNNGTIFNITINEKEINAEEIPEISLKDLSEIDTIKLITVFSQDIKNSLIELSSKIENLNKDFEELPVYLQGNNQSKVPEILTKFADTFDNLCRLVTLTALFPNDFQNIIIEGVNLSDFIKDFAPFLEDFEKAIIDNDTVTIGDIAEYEIKPRFEAFCDVIKEI